MRKNKWLNIVLTLIMLLSTILTPQITYAISENLDEEDTKETEQVEVDGASDGNVEEQVETADDSDEGMGAQVEEAESRNNEEPVEDESIPAAEDKVADETPEDIRNNDPPTEEAEDGEENTAFETVLFSDTEYNPITSFTFNINKNDGSTLEIEDGQNIEINFDEISSVFLSYGLTKPDELDIEPGDTYVIDLPTVIQVGDVEVEPIIVHGEQVATYDIVDGQMLITFTEAVNRYDDIEMFVELYGLFNTEIFETEEEVAIEVPFSDGSSYTVTVRPEQQEYEGKDTKTAGTPYTLNEEGSQNETNRNPEYIDWTVRANDAAESIEKATIIDDLDEHLEIVEDSIVVEKIIRNYNNEEIGRDL